MKYLQKWQGALNDSFQRQEGKWTVPGVSKCLLLVSVVL